MIKIAVLEDNDSDAALLSDCVERYFVHTGEEYSLDRFSTAISFLEKYNSSFDIVFMDIELPDLNGLKTAHKMRKLDGNSALVFITNMAQFAVNGYEVNAFDFIIKPVKYPIFVTKMHRIMDYVYRMKGNDLQLLIKTEEGTYRLNASRIKYVEVMNHDLIYHLDKNETVASRGQIKEIERQLIPAGFFKCNRCYLINLKHVTAIKDSFVTIDGDELQISRGRKKEFLAAVAKYF